MSSETDQPRILVVDSERPGRVAARRCLSRLGAVMAFSDVESATEQLADEGGEVLIVVDGPGIPAIRVLERLRREHPAVEVVLLARDAGAAASALDAGAQDSLVLPVRESQLRHCVDRVLERRALRAEARDLHDTLHVAEECRALTPCLDSGKVYPLTLDLLLGSLSRSRGVAVFHRSALSLGDAVAFRGFAEREARRLREILLEHKPVDLDGFRLVETIDRGAVHEALREAGIETPPLLAVPIVGEEAEAGVIWILGDGRPFDSAEIARAKLISEYATAALRNAERYQRAKERANVDDVTEVYNARYLVSATENEIRRAERYGNPLSILFLDIDRFKLVNDRYGHLVGSNSLRSLSQLLLQCVRQVDTLSRYGGDEFTIILVDTDHDEALEVAERIRRTVEDHVFEARGSASLRLTISVGVASYPAHGSTRDVLLDTADKAMYRAKSLGRNRVTSAGELSR